MSQQQQAKLSRRTLFGAAATTGAVAAAATLLPSVQPEAPAEAGAKQPPARGGGYQLSEHVKQYYRTTRL